MIFSENLGSVDSCLRRNDKKTKFRNDRVLAGMAINKIKLNKKE